ncbi:MAG: class I SAM-dependent methyltransferase [Haliea sp.]
MQRFAPNSKTRTDRWACWRRCWEKAACGDGTSRSNSRPRRILEAGCGNGVATLVLAKQSSARITALDSDEGALERLRTELAAYHACGGIVSYEMFVLQKS